MTAPPTNAELPEFAITVSNLSKVYNPKSSRPVNALADLSLSIPRGSIFGLLGPNGAGKSTFINILSGMTIKSAGQVTVWGIDMDQDPRNARAALGIMPQEINLDPFFCPHDVLEIIAGLYGVPKSERRSMEMLREMKLADQAFASARSLSGGMRRRVMICKAMAHNPPILILDEPTAGVDIELRKLIWQHVKKLNRRGVTIILTTHYLQEAEELCEYIAIIDDGKLVVNDRKKKLLSIFDSKILNLNFKQAQSQPPRLSGKLANCEVVASTDNQISIKFPPSKITASAIVSELLRQKFQIEDLSTQESNLEDIFLQLIKTGPQAKAS